MKKVPAKETLGWQVGTVGLEPNKRVGRFKPRALTGRGTLSFWSRISTHYIRRVVEVMDTSRQRVVVCLGQEFAGEKKE